MQFTIRRYTVEDIPRMMFLLSESLHEIKADGQGHLHRDIDLSREKVYNLLRSNVRNIRFFANLVEVDGEVIGGMIGEVKPLVFSDECIAIDHMLYIQPDHRRYKIVRALVTTFVTWARRRDVCFVEFSIGSGFKHRQFGMLAKRLGFVPMSEHYMQRMEP